MTEHDLQSSIIDECNLRANQEPLFGRIFAVPNGGARSVVVGRKLKAEGVKRGVPDLVWPIPRGDYNGLVMELKVGRNKASAEQNEWLEFFESIGWYACVVHDDPAVAMNVLEWYFGGAA
jgi:hypothetical protein